MLGADPRPFLRARDRRAWHPDVSPLAVSSVCNDPFLKHIFPLGLTLMPDFVPLYPPSISILLPFQPGSLKQSSPPPDLHGDHYFQLSILEDYYFRL